VEDQDIASAQGRRRRRMFRTTTNHERSPNPHREPKDHAGYAVCDPEGRRIGTARQVFANGRGEPEYVRVRMGFLGLRSALIPVGFVRIDEQHRVFTLQ
jgi:hypothetical protein